MAQRTLTDSGLETWLVFVKAVTLPDFASFPLLDEPDGSALLAEYFRDHLQVAQRSGAGVVLETPTWRANADWGARLGYDAAALDRINRDSVDFLRQLAAEFPEVDVQVSGNLGPRGDGYAPDQLMSADEAESYHQAQIDSFAAAGADRVTILTATHAGEAVGVARAAARAEIPAVISFTVETDGRLPSGQSLFDAIAEVDSQTFSYALYFGINCAHPDHFTASLDASPTASGRIGLLRANASRMSHAELDEAEELDDGDPDELASQYADLVARHPSLQLLGGCCGTDVRHVAAIARTCLSGT